MAHRGRQNADEALILALASGSTIGTAAQRAGLSRRTAQRRLADPVFRGRVDDARAAMIEQAVGRLADAATAAAKTLETLLRSNFGGTIRLGAARAILELGNRLRESVDLDRRLAALEAKVKDDTLTSTTGPTRKDCLQ